MSDTAMSSAPSQTRSASWRIIVPFVVIALMVLLPFVVGTQSYLLGIAVRAMLFIALGQAWNVVAGIGGQLSLGHGVFFGVGAYGTAILFNSLGLTPWIGGVLGAVASIAVAGLMGAATFRLRGVYFALATVAISLCLEKLARHFIGITGGDAGLAVRFIGDSLSAAQSRSPLPFFFASLVMVVAYYVLTRRLLRSKFGYQLQAVRDDEEAAAASGVPVFRTKMWGLILSAGMTALTGALYVQFYLAIDPGAAFGLGQAIQIQLPSLIGGLGTAGGPVIGGAIMILVSEVTNWLSARTAIHGLDILAYGAILLIVVMFVPGGLLGRTRRGA
ncbi:MAG TPA: branched-chain amino acid ABC transporter permease [Pseudolabrys sp.]|nr:branched-chain amino acid ABC transporter permease [Pseudolabrys sp.]